MTIVGNKFDGNLKVIQHKLLNNFLIEVDHKAISRQFQLFYLMKSSMLTFANILRTCKQAPRHPEYNI